MRKIKIVQLHFIDFKTKDIIRCAYNIIQHCTSHCTACQIDESSFDKTVTCLRGSFQFGEIE